MVFNVEYELEKRFIKGLRAIFEKDSDFSYNNDEEVTGVVITTDYPEDQEVPLKIPHLIITGIGFQSSTENTFGYNFMADEKAFGLVNGVQSYANIVPYSLTIICAGNRNDSKDLASKLSEYITFSASYYLNETMDLQISTINKSPTGPSKQFPQKLFETNISIQGTLYWIGRKGPEAALDDIDKPLKNINIRF